MSNDPLESCTRCSMSFPRSELRLDPNGGWACTDCLAGKPMRERIRGISSVEEFDSFIKEKYAQNSSNPLRTYKCRCGYQFQRREDKKITRCPYCGREPSAFNKELNAQDLLNEAE